MTHSLNKWTAALQSVHMCVELYMFDFKMYLGVISFDYKKQKKPILHLEIHKWTNRRP